MPRFFNRIRKQLAKENKFFQYSRYAIGEILLVVIGILLALQINEWNQERLNRQEEQSYLQRLQQDLLSDLEQIEGVRRNYETRLILGLEILDSLGSDNGSSIRKWPHYRMAQDNFSKGMLADTLSMGQKFFLVLVFSRFTPTDITFQELLSTGKINIFSDELLKNTVQYYYADLVKQQRFQEDIVMEVQKAYRYALLDNHISNYNHNDFATIREKIISPDQLITTLENYLMLTNNMLNGLYYDQNSTYQQTKGFLQQIQNKTSN
jgi:hypothetical protein